MCVCVRVCVCVCVWWEGQAVSRQQVEMMESRGGERYE